MTDARQYPVLVERENFQAFLRGRMSSWGVNVSGLAKRLGISQQAAYALLSGDLKPSEAILQKTGLEIVYRAVPDKR